MRSLDKTGADGDEDHPPDSCYAMPKTQPSRRRVRQSNDRKRLMFGSSDSSGDEADTERDPARQPIENRTDRKEIALKRSESMKKSSPAKRSTSLMNPVTSSSSSDPDEYLQATQPRHILKPPKFDGSTSFEMFWAQFRRIQPMDKAGQVSVFARRTSEGSRTDTMGLRSGGDKLAEEAYEDVERTIRWSNPVR